MFDAAILIALTQYPKEELLATLLIFRVIYYMVPFALALTIMICREAMIALKDRRCTQSSETKTSTDKLRHHT